MNKRAIINFPLVLWVKKLKNILIAQSKFNYLTSEIKILHKKEKSKHFEVNLYCRF
jgi:hypothetical protein